MPQFYFHFTDPMHSCRDEHGLDFATAEEAYLQAYTAAEAMWGDLLHDRIDPHGCAFEINDAMDNLLFRLPFTELIERCRPPTYPEPARHGLGASVGRYHARALSAHTEIQTGMVLARRSLDEMIGLVNRL